MTDYNVGETVPKAGQGGVNRIDSAAKRKINELVSSLSKSKDAYKMEEIENELLGLAGKSQTNAKMVIDSVSYFMRTNNKIKGAFTEEKSILLETRLGRAVDILTVVCVRAGKGSLLSGLVIKIFKGIVKGDYPGTVRTDARAMLSNWKIPGYEQAREY